MIGGTMHATGRDWMAIYGSAPDICFMPLPRLDFQFLLERWRPLDQLHDPFHYFLDVKGSVLG